MFEDAVGRRLPQSSWRFEFFQQCPIQPHLHLHLYNKRTVLLHILFQAVHLMLLTWKQQNEVFNEALRDSTLPSPIQNHDRRLSEIAEYFQADNAVLRKEKRELKEFLNKRTERQPGKRVILKGKFVITTEIYNKDLVDAERNTKKKSLKGKSKRTT